VQVRARETIFSSERANDAHSGHIVRQVRINRAAPFGQRPTARNVCTALQCAIRQVRVAGSNPGDIWGGENLQGTMMRYGLTLTSFLERAGKLFPGLEVISRLPDNSVRRSSYSDLYRRARALGARLQQLGSEQVTGSRP
jgi:hypothetical protein